MGYYPTRQVNNNSVSWCRAEVAAQSPKSITRLLAEDLAPSPQAVTTTAADASTPPPSKASAPSRKLPPPPPVVTMSLSMKTVVSPRTHTHEVVALSILVHREVRLDGASDENGSKVRHWSHGIEHGTIPCMYRTVVCSAVESSMRAVAPELFTVV